MTLLEDFRYYEYMLIDFYYNHYFLLVSLIVGGLTLISIVWLGFAFYRADRESEEEKKTEKRLNSKGKRVELVDIA